MIEQRFTDEQVKSAIRQFLQYGEDGLDDGRDLPGNIHKGYFSGNGFAAAALRWHLAQLEQTQEPQLDSEGYPTEETLKAVREWPASDLPGLFEYLYKAWRYDGYKLQLKDKMVHRLTTGGWSGNEDLIAALQGNHICWTLTWVLSKRGGLHVFDLSRTKVK